MQWARDCEYSALRSCGACPRAAMAPISAGRGDAVSRRHAMGADRSAARAGWRERELSLACGFAHPHPFTPLRHRLELRTPGKRHGALRDADLLILQPHQKIHALRPLVLLGQEV